MWSRIPAAKRWMIVGFSIGVLAAILLVGHRAFAVGWPADRAKGISFDRYLYDTIPWMMVSLIPIAIFFGLVGGSIGLVIDKVVERMTK